MVALASCAKRASGMTKRLDAERLGRALEFVLGKAAPTVQHWERVAAVVIAAYEANDPATPPSKKVTA